MLVWIIFLSLITVFLSLDLGIFNRVPHIISSKEASFWTVLWVSIALSFSGVIYWVYSANIIHNIDQLSASEATIKYITGYLIELSLSLDNIFVIAIIFSSFKVPMKYQHRVLFWGILGAIVFRGLMIFFGVYLIHKFSWVTYIFGAFLIYTSYKMLVTEEEKEFRPRDSFVYKTFKKFIPVTRNFQEEHFFVKRRHIIAATPLFIVLIIIEFTDILFALDSVPAILAITSDPFLVFSSNIFAIMGLRSMYFFLSNMMEKFAHLRYSLIAILTFVGVKLILTEYVHFPEWVSLTFIGLSLGIGIVVSLRQK
ncbi:MAG: TerC family protein [Saprospiraceae bacterium]|nr:TerC family protein [Saprospiraceae bacterium]MCB9324452.1 TerC family protein [Lewinellaceae bacterium]